MSEYQEYFVKFHKDRLKSMNPRKPLSCNGCKGAMRFHSQDNTLMLTCGEKGVGKCGEQFTITLPEYVSYSRETTGMMNAINGKYYNDDPYDVSRYPLKAISKIAPLSKSEAHALSEQTNLVDNARKDLIELKKLYERENNLSGYVKKVQDLHGLRREVQRKRLRLMTQINKETDHIKRKELFQDYAKTSLIANEIYPLIALLEEPWNDYVNVKEGSVTKKNDTYLSQEKPKKAPKKVPKKAPKPKNKPQKPNDFPQEPVADETLDCSKFKTNKGKRCPECCSGHPERCMWVPKEGCKPK